MPALRKPVDKPKASQGQASPPTKSTPPPTKSTPPPTKSVVDNTLERARAANPAAAFAAPPTKSTPPPTVDARLAQVDSPFPVDPPRVPLEVEEPVVPSTPTPPSAPMANGKRKQLNNENKADRRANRTARELAEEERKAANRASRDARRAADRKAKEDRKANQDNQKTAREKLQQDGKTERRSMAASVDDWVEAGTKAFGAVSDAGGVDAFLHGSDVADEFAPTDDAPEPSGGFADKAMTWLKENPLLAAAGALGGGLVAKRLLGL